MLSYFIVLVGFAIGEKATFEEEIVKLEETHLGKTFLDTVQIAV